ncbi:hypothetical protein [Pseudohongiella sp.]|uniref:Signal transduction histidine kinase subgroup 3 dimerisation and phosphoacceptor domain-containing protein n=1 Tax=marine sediment metagenome TaxID=412755 RepID=A0A0F9Z348_9ZZZZ|nr:hypothetical protein [Pseudohongiella sp.]HDZ09203.1 hypothetical protein [Pseudohongiella sp.]HEA63369.1 hypothetical protein [Pseudohongiella sp.]
MSLRLWQIIVGVVVVLVMAALALVTMLSGGQPDSARGSLFLTSAQAASSGLVSPQQSSPPWYLGDDAWRPTPLPRSWSADSLQPATETQAWYRLPLPPQAHDNNWRHLLLLRHMMNMEVWLDEHYLGSAGPLASGQLQRNWNRPVTWTLPEALVTGAPQMLYVRLHSAPNFGVMSPMILGDEATVTNRYRLNYFLQIDLVKISLLAMVFIACLGAFVWARIRQGHWLLIALMSISWSFPLLYILLPTVPTVLPGEFDFLRLSHWGTVAGALCLLAFIYSYYLRVAVNRLRWLLAVSLVHGVILLAVPDRQVVFAGSIGQLFAQLLFVILIIQLLRVRSLRNTEVYSIIAGLVIMLMAAGHDVSLAISNSMERWRWDMFVSYITQPVMMIIVTWHGVRAYLDSVTRLDDINRQLLHRLAEAEKNLREVFSQQVKLQRDNHLASEREQVYRDLHDDMGARLLSLVFKVEQGKARDLARSALQDLRDIVRLVMHEEHQLAAVLADCMAENESRASSLQKTFSWHVNDMLDGISCSNRRMLKLRLLLRELSGFWLRMPETRSLTLTVSLVDDNSVGIDGRVLQVEVTIEGSAADDPAGVPPLLHKRLRALDAVSQVHTGAGQGMSVCIPLPVTAATPPDSAQQSLSG